jgi:aryl-alcohol dehydrogenase-like predicted oxidoreductase
MEYVRLGRSNLKISRLGFGAMGIGDKAWRNWVLDEREAGPVLDRAFDLGINFFDTCDFYSAGRSEEILGRWLKAGPAREDVVVATKAGNPMGRGPNRRGYSRKHLFAAIDASLTRLGLAHVDLFQTHIWDPATGLDELVDAFDAIVRAGKALYVGITDMPAWQFATAYHLQERRGLTRFVSVQNHYNAIWREDERELMPFARSQAIGLISYSPMGRGFLCGQGRHDGTRPTERTRTDDYAQKIFGRPSDHAVGEAIEKIAAARGSEPSQIALAFVLSRRFGIAPIIGATRAEQLDQAVAALEIQLTAAEVAEIEAPYQPRPATPHG